MIRRPVTSDYLQPRVRVKRTVRSLLSPEQLNQAVGRESARIDRKSGGSLTLVLFRLPTKGRTKLSAVRLARTILKRIRVTDDVGWFDSEHLGLLLPDTTPAGAWKLASSICQASARRGTEPLCTMYTYGEDAQAPVVVRSSDTAPLAAKVAS
jgi:hypothetical protein